MKKLVSLGGFLLGLIFVLSSNTLLAGTWERVWGPTDLVVMDGESNLVYAKPIGAKNIHEWSGQPFVWKDLGMTGQKFVTALQKPNNALFCLGVNGNVYRYNSQSGLWTSIGTPENQPAANIYGGPDGLLAINSKTGDVYKWQWKTGAWPKIGGPGKMFAVGRYGSEFMTSIYGLSPDNAPPDTKGVYHYDGMKWVKKGGPAGNIYVGASVLYATNPTSGDILSPMPNWKRIGGPGKMFATDNVGRLYGLSVDGKVVTRWTGTPNQWEHVGGAADKIFAGGDGLLFATNPDTKDLWHLTPGPGPGKTQAAAPDFSKAKYNCPIRPTSGYRNVLVILWDPKRPQHPAPPKSQIEQLLFGSGQNVYDWFSESSGGKLIVQNAGVLGWYNSDKQPGQWYWDFNQTPGPSAKDDGDGFLQGHVRKWWEAVRNAGNQFNFAKYDKNNDKVLSADELTILVAIPQNSPRGFVRTPAGRQYPNWQPLTIQGVKIPEISEWYIGNPPNFGAPAHELCHHLLLAADMYFDSPWRFSAGVYSIMDYGYSSGHLDPFHKLKLGWLSYKIVSNSGVYNLKDVEKGREVLILYDPARGGDEYFIIENRWRGTSYDKGARGAGGIPTDGVAIWHIIENPAVFSKIQVIADPMEWGRRGIRLFRANGGNPVDDNIALFQRKNGKISSNSFPGLRWIDGKDTPFELQILTDPGPDIRIDITVRH